MLGRIYPHAVLLIFVNIILKASCKGSGSLTLVIDDTDTMTDDIDQVKRSVDRISDIVFNEKSSQIGNMVLVTFNDPEATVKTVTNKRHTFKKILNAVNVTYNINNSDCWEPSMKGLRLALENSNRDSYIYVFTDAPAKDYRDSHYVTDLCQKKQSQIVFVLTGRCGDYHDAASFNVYYDIAQACAGQAFDVKRNQVEEVLRTTEETIKGNKTVYTSTIVPAGVKKQIPFTIDDHTDYAIVSVSGKNVYLDIKGPSFTLEKIMWNDNGKVAKLNNAKPGAYVATVMGQTRTSVVIVGRTDFFFNHGFSKEIPNSLGDTSLQPISKLNVYLSISVTDEHQSIQIMSVQILDINENPINGPMTLTKISKDFYVTNQFVAPSQRFKLAVKGIVKASGKSIKRIGKIPITPQEPQIIAPSNTRPTVEIAEGKATKIEYNTTVKLTCKVKAFPEPKIAWVNMKGDVMPSKMSPEEFPYKYISYMDISYASKGERYKCYATNDFGRDERTINVIVKDPITYKSGRSRVTKLAYGKEGILTCDITSHFPIDIHWYYANEITGQASEILTSDKYEVSASRTQLKIKKMDLDLVGRYTCKVSLKNKKDVQKSFLTRVQIDGLIAPKVQLVPKIKITKGKTAVIECKVESGIPAPKITWLFGGKSGATFIPIGSESVLRITNVDNKHEGKYKCLAENVLSKDEQITTLFVQDLPKITTSTSTIYPATEGDAVLRIPCVAVGVPEPVIIWKLSGRNITPNAKYSIESGTLIIRSLTVSDTNSYTCEAKNEAGASSATFKTYIRQAPKVLGDATKKVTIGSPASIECRVKGEPKPIITWQYMDKSSSKFVPIAGSETTLRITNTKKTHAGIYKCVAQDTVGSNEHITTLIVEYLPEITTSSSTIYQATEGDTLLRIPCVAAGVPKPMIIWKLSGRNITPNAKYSIENGALIIRAPTVSDTNSYTCEAKNEAGVSSATFRTYIRQAPKVLGDATKKVTIGSPASIECRVNGEPKPTITWQYMDKSSAKFVPIAGSETTLRITNVKKTHAGSYKCVAQNTVGSNEHITTLIVEYLPEITTNSSTIYQATEGDTLLRIPCLAAGVPKSMIIWKLSGRNITPNAKYSIENGALIIRAPTVSDTNSYTCEAKNEAGVSSATFRTYIRQAPKVLGDATKKVTIGSPASIECRVNGEPKPTITWQYMDKSSAKFVPIAGSETTLRITNVKKTHAGSYKCVAQNTVGSNEHITTLIVEYLPEITTNSSTIYQATEGDTLLRIPCLAAGVPKSMIIWKLSGRNITPNAKYSIENGALIIRAPTVSDTNSYTCEAKNEAGVSSATFRTYIRQAPKVLGDATKKVTIGSPASIECRVNGEPKPTITWQYMDKSSAKFVPIAGSETTLRITNVKKTHAGSYKCVAQNTVGSNEHITTLIVEYLPEITTNSSTIYQATEGDTLLRIPCLAAGVPKSMIIWKLSGRNITPNAKYSIENGALIIRAPTVSDTNSYTCEAKNEAGVSSATFRTYIRQAPKVLGDATKKVTIGSPASIECRVNGEPKPTITWQYMDKSSAKFVPIAGSETTLHITNVKKTHAGSYKCVAQNTVGSNEHITTLIVEYLPEITTNSSTIYQATEGDTLLRIPCLAAGVPKSMIIWKLSGRNITPNAKYSIENGALIIRGPTVSDTNSYTCEAKNEVGVSSATFRTYIHQAPKVSGTKKVKIGFPASIECRVEGAPKPTITWQFMAKSSSLFYPIPGSNQVLNIPRVDINHAGRYKCIAENNVGKNSHITTLEVQDIPRILSDISTIYQSTEGDALLKIPCVAAGLPKPTITWKLNGRVINPSRKYSVEDGTLIIREPKVSDTNSYTCEAKNEVGTVSATFKTYIRHAAGITTNSSTVEGVVGDLALRIPCNAVGVPKPVITWKLKGTTITTGSKYLIEDGALVITKPTEKDTSSYTCEAKNHINSVSVTFPAKVDKYPRSSGTVHYVYLKPDETRKLKCDAYNSTSQSLKWFITRKIPDVSKTTSPTETSTISSKVSTKLRTITQDAGNKEHINIASASSSDHDGNYTCHVSDKHGNTQTHTYVVDVGIAPKFLFNDNSIDKWEGDINDIKGICEIDKDAKPTPVVQWMYNGKMLTDLRLAGVGHYSCNVSNVHGYVLKPFDVKSSVCLINRHLSDTPYTPLVLNDQGSWHNLENTEYYTIIKQEVKIILSCPSQKETSNTFKNFPKRSTLETFCDKGNLFWVEGKLYKLSDLQCTNSIQLPVIKKKGKCSTETSELISVGYNVPGFLEAYEVCFDHKRNMPLYTRIVMTENNNYGGGSYNWYTYPGIGTGKTERGFTCKDASSSCCYSKSQLVNAIDFNDGPAKKSTFNDPLNVIPVWLPCDTSKPSWKDINDMVRTQLPFYNDIVVWSGMHTLQEKNGAVIPRYLWKVVSLEDDEVMAIVHVNDPKPTKSDIRCKTPDVCDKYEEWLVTDDSTYCCSLPDFLKSFDIHGTDIGERMTAVLDKIKMV